MLVIANPEPMKKMLLKGFKLMQSTMNKQKKKKNPNRLLKVQ